MFILSNIRGTRIAAPIRVVRRLSRPSAIALLLMGTLGLCWTSEARAFGPGSSVDLQVLSTSIAADMSGNIYYLDTAQSQLYKVSSNGDQTEIFCCAGISSGLNKPRGLAIDNDGNLYIANTGSNQIIKLNSSSQASIVNTGFYSLSRPAGIALDASGDLYIADSGNSRIIEVAAAGGQASTVDTGEYKLSNPSSVFVGKDGTIYISDTGNNRIVAVPTSDPPTALFSNQLNSPLSVTIDGDGNAYIAQTDTHAPSQKGTDGVMPAVVSSFSATNLNVDDGGGSQGTIASANITLTPMGGFHGTVYLSVIGLPPHVLMQLAHPIVSFQGSGPVADLLQVGESKTTDQSRLIIHGLTHDQHQGLGLAMAGLLPFSILMLIGFGASSRKLAKTCKMSGILTLLLILPALAMGTSGCKGGYPAGLFGNSTYTATLIARPVNGQPYSLGSFGITVLK
jgi:sugar lactone lactonase YvrE